MADVFAAATGTLFADPNIGKAAIWQPVDGGEEFAVRAVISTPEQIVGVQGTEFMVEGVLIDIRLTGVRDPAVGDRVFVPAAGVTYELTVLRPHDALGLRRTCEAVIVS